MPKYFAVPSFYKTFNAENGASTPGFIKIYDATATLINTVAQTDVNATVYFSNPDSGEAYLFAGSDTTLIIYNAADVIKPNTPNPASTTIQVPYNICGIAVQPGSMDLYVATFDFNGNAYIYSYSHASGYAAGSQAQFASVYDSWNDLASICANLAFDPQGNLWMTTYQDGSAAPGDHFLICFTQANTAAGSAKYFFKLSNSSTDSSAPPAAIPVVQLPGSSSAVNSPLYAFSEPHGIAFDPLGNLWMSNNSDDSNVNGYNAEGAVNGSLLRLDRDWIDTNLLCNTSLVPATGLAGTPTANGYGGTLLLSPGAGVTLYGLAGGRFGGLTFDGFTLYISDQSAALDPKHSFVWQLDTEGLAANTAPIAGQFTQSKLPTIYPGNCTIAIFNTTPAQLLIRDLGSDTGVEPDSAADPTSWESPDIGISATTISTVTNVPSPSAIDLTTLGTIAGTPPSTLYVYVRVANKKAIAGTTPATSPADMTGTEVLKLYWAKASAGLDWPLPWNQALPFDSNSTATNPLPYGGLIGAQTIGVIDQGNESVLQFTWTGVPNTTEYSVNDGHFCLIARVEQNALYPFGMDYPEAVGQFTAEGEVSVGANTYNNRAIGWRNVAIDAPPSNGSKFGPIHLGVLGANYTFGPKIFHFAIETLNRAGLPTHIPGKFTLVATGRTLDRLLEKQPEAHAELHLGDGRFPLHDLCIRLHPKEVLPFRIEFEPAIALQNYAVRVVQYELTRRGPKVTGGQTFVIGKVAGLHDA